MIRWLAEAQLAEKAFIATGGPEHFETVQDHIGMIDELGGELKSNLENAEDIGLVDGTLASIAEYTAAFKSYADFLAEQKTAAGRMAATAGKAQRLCNETTANEKDRMHREVASVVRLLVIGAVLSVFFGTVMALIMTRGITPADQPGYRRPGRQHDEGRRSFRPDCRHQ